MSSDDAKHVQTELGEDEYERFRAFASERGLSIKEAGHEALVEWVERQQQVDPNDRAFTVLDELGESSLPATAVTPGPKTIRSSSRTTATTKPSR